MSSPPATVSTDYDYGYFDTPVRRGQFNTQYLETNARLPSVVILQAEYDNLRLTAKQYENLRRNLLRGGVGEETVDLLSHDDQTVQGGNCQTTSFPNGNPAEEGHPAWADGDGDGEEEDDDDHVAGETDLAAEGPPGANHTQSQGHRQQYERQCARTIQLSNLAEGTTHADIINAVRGGMLLDVFLRSHERPATVSFLQSADAKSFLDHVRRHDLYIRNKRIDVKWSDRQFLLPGHVASKIAMGASRNLVIRGCDKRLTEDTIREDLDHIHNLVVVKVEFIGGNCHINLNSVHNAVYARQCMMSRLRYKGTKLHYDEDECAQPYPQPAQKPRGESSAKKTSVAAPNRFHLLHLDDGEEDEIAATFQSKKSVEIVT